MKAKRFDEKEVHRFLSYENTMCIWKQTEKPIQNKGSFLSLQPKVSLQCSWEANF